MKKVLIGMSPFWVSGSRGSWVETSREILDGGVIITIK